MAGLTNITNVPLKNYLVSQAQEEGAFNCGNLFKPFPIDKHDFKVTILDPNNEAQRVLALQNNDDGTVPTVIFQYTTADQTSKTIAVRTFISRKDSQNTIEPVLSTDEQNKVFLLLQLLLQHKEADAVTLATTAGNYGANTQALTGVQQWNDPSSTPYTDLKNWCFSANGTSLKRTNFIQIPDLVFAALSEHPDTPSRLSTIKEKVLTVDSLAILIGDGVAAEKQIKVYIPMVFYNASNSATKNMQRHWGKNVIVGYENPKPSDMIRKQTYGNDFQMKNTKDYRVLKYAREDQRGYYIDVEVTYSLRLDANNGFLGTAVIA